MTETPWNKRRIVAVGLLTEQDLRVLGPAFNRAWPVDENPRFGDLLAAIDEADRSICGMEMMQKDRF